MKTASRRDVTLPASSTIMPEIEASALSFINEVHDTLTQLWGGKHVVA